jgi:hypothetical protein
MRAADRLHCTPWELLKQGRFWQEAALAAISAENGAAVERQKAADRKAKAARRMGVR